METARSPQIGSKENVDGGWSLLKVSDMPVRLFCEPMASTKPLTNSGEPESAGQYPQLRELPAPPLTKLKLFKRADSEATYSRVRRFIMVGNMRFQSSNHWVAKYCKCLGLGGKLILRHKCLVFAKTCVFCSDRSDEMT